MADLTDVSNALVSLIEPVVYPNGISQPSIASVEVSIFPGWPIRNKLDDTMKTGNAMVSVYPTNKERDVTKFERIFKDVSYVPATLTAEVLDDTVTLGGTNTVEAAVMIVVDNVGYSYQVLITDTLDDIAAALAALIPGATSLANVLTVPFINTLVARITETAVAAMELGRRERVFQISCWCPTPDIRNLLAPPIDVYLQLNYQILLSDGFYCHTFYDHSHETDDLEIPNIYRRDLFFRVQYATTYAQTFTTVAHTPIDTTIET